MTETPIIRVEQESLRNWFTYHGRNLSHLLLLECHILDLVCKLTIFVIESNIETLRAVDLISILAWGLLNLILSDFTVLLFVLG